MSISSLNNSQSTRSHQERKQERDKIVKIMTVFKMQVPKNATLEQKHKLCFDGIVDKCRKKQWKQLEQNKWSLNGLYDESGKTILQASLAFLEPKDLREIFLQNLAHFLSSGKLAQVTHEMILRKKNVLFTEAIKHLDVKRPDEQGRTLLHIAASTGNLEAVQVLLKHKDINIDAKDLSDRTPLLLASACGHQNVALLLIENQANLLAKTVEKKTVLHEAAHSGSDQVLKKVLSTNHSSSLVNQYDKYGHSPLHDAAYKPSNQSIIDMLFKAGVNLHAQNHCGDTALHILAKFGEVDSIRHCLNAKANLACLNHKQLTPIDEAIQNKHEDVLGLFFGLKQFVFNNFSPNKKKLTPALAGVFLGLEQINVKNSSSNEKALEQALVQAKENNQIPNQIYCLVKVSHLFIGKRDYKTSAKFLNSALAVAMQSNFNSQIVDYLFIRIEVVEKMLIQSKGYKVSPNYRSRLREKRESLAKIRKEYETNLMQDRGKLTAGFKSLLSDQIDEIMAIMGPLPTKKNKWACLGMGSMARNEMCPYSDLEFAFLIKIADSASLDYFRDLSEILEMRIINFGETKFPAFGENKESPTPDGFCLDGGGNTPLGVKNLYELIGTPQMLTQYISHGWLESNIILTNVLTTVCRVAGDRKLVSTYEKEKKAALNVHKNGLSLRKHLALKLLQGHIIEFKPDLSYQKEQTSAFGIKKELYRPFQAIIGSLALYFGLRRQTTNGRLRELQKKKVFSQAAVKNLSEALSSVLTLRFKAHLFYQDEKEFLVHQKQEFSKETFLSLDKKLRATLTDIYRTLIPFHGAGLQFYDTKNPSVFKNQNFYDEDFNEQAEKFSNQFKYDQAKESYQKTLSLDPNDFSTLVSLIGINSELSTLSESVSRSTQALAEARENYGEKSSKTWLCLQILAKSFISACRPKEALKPLNEALEMFDEGFQDIPTLLILGQALKDLEQLTEARQKLEKALSLAEKKYSKNHRVVGVIHHDLAGLYTQSKNYKKALEHYQHALAVIKNQPPKLQRELPRVWADMSKAFVGLGEYQQALNYQLKAKQKLVERFGLKSVKVGSALYALGEIYTYMNQSDQSLKSYQAAVQVYSQLSLAEKDQEPLAFAKMKLGDALIKTGNLEKAAQCYEESKNLFLKIKGENDFMVATARLVLADTYCEIADKDKDANRFEAALKNYQKSTEELTKSLKMYLEQPKHIHEKIKPIKKKLFSNFMKLLTVSMGLMAHSNQDLTEEMRIYVARALKIAEGLDGNETMIAKMFQVQVNQLCLKSKKPMFKTFNFTSK